MIDGVHFRVATKADYEFGYQVKKAAMRPYITEVWGWDEDEQRDYYHREFCLDDTYVIMLEDQPIGWLVDRRVPEGRSLEQLYLLPEFQNRGIGSGIIGRIIAEARSEAIPVLLGVIKCNHRAAGLYRRLGFTIYGQTEQHWLMRTEPR